MARTFCLPDGRPPVAGAAWIDAGKMMEVATEEAAAPFELPDIVTESPESVVYGRCAVITKELMEATWHPRRVEAYMGGVEALDGV